MKKYYSEFITIILYTFVYYRILIEELLSVKPTQWK